MAKRRTQKELRKAYENGEAWITRIGRREWPRADKFPIPTREDAAKLWPCLEDLVQIAAHYEEGSPVRENEIFPDPDETMKTASDLLDKYIPLKDVSYGEPNTATLPSAKQKGRSNTAKGGKR